MQILLDVVYEVRRRIYASLLSATEPDDALSEARDLRSLHAASGLVLRSADFSLEAVATRLVAGHAELEVVERYRESLAELAQADCVHETRGAQRWRASFDISGDRPSLVALDEIVLEDRPFPESLGAVGGSAGAAHPVQAKWSWDGAAAATYARQYALKPNPHYRTFPLDCTNFASQCLLAGGKTEVGLSWQYEDLSKWFYAGEPLPPARSWTQAIRLLEHLIAHTNSEVATRKLDLALGDLVIFKPRSGSDSGHATVVTKKTSTEIFLSYHSNDTLDKAYESVRAKFPPASHTVHFVRVGNAYS